MRQNAFEARHNDDWDRFQAWLDAHGRFDATLGRTVPAVGFDSSEFPARYRRICQQLALARDRQYSPDLVDRLNQLALAGHHALYGAGSDRLAGVIEFVSRGFAIVVRREWRIVLVSALLFFGSGLTLALITSHSSDAIYYLLEPFQIAQLQEMYSNDSSKALGRRPADSDLEMFGFYIWNNIRIGFQTFATGIVFGLGTLFYLVFNGVYLGAIAGLLIRSGAVTPFFSFVSGHSAMELVAIALCGAAGLRIGLALVAPGRQSRRESLIAAARSAIRIVYGATAMFLMAAFIEAFWSAHTYVPVAAKYGIGIAMWIAIGAYFLFAGRGRETHDDAS